MKILNRFTIKDLKLNKKRTIVTIIGIILSTALICGVVGLVASFQKTFINMEKEEDGYYHTIFKNTQKDELKYIQNNEKVGMYFVTQEAGWSKLEGCKNNDKPYVRVLEYDDNALQNYGIQLEDGRLPQNNNEVVIADHVRSNGRVNLNIGDKITLNLGTRKSDDGTVINPEVCYTNGMKDENGNEYKEGIVDTQEKTYTVVGIMRRPNYSVEGYTCPGYTFISKLENYKDNVDVAVAYSKPKDTEEANEELCKALNCNKDEDVKVNRELLRYQGVLSDGMMNALYSIAGVVIVIIVVSSVFVIRNSFSISVSEKNRQYGMLASIGATSKQIKKNVLFEGFIIGLIAVPLGILAGVIAIIILLQVVNYLLGDMLMGMKFVYNLPIIPVLIAIAISFITIYLSCLIPAKRAAKISPIESIRGNNDIKIKPKKMKTNKFIKKVFGIGGTIANKNLKRSKKKYRTTVISIVISIVIFISLSSFMECGNKASGLYYTEMNFNTMISRLDEESYKELVKLDNVENYSYYFEKSADIDVDKYGTKYRKDAIEENATGISVMAYNNEYFKQLVKKSGLDVANYRDIVFLVDDIVVYNTDNTKAIEKLYNLHEGDELSIKLGERDRKITIAKNLEDRPMGMEGTYYTAGALVVSEDFLGDLKKDSVISNLFIDSDNATALENKLNDLSKEDIKFENIEVLNYETLADQENRMVLVIAIFLYGFITVISLIGVTNIFNTITTNMILRSKEFAMLKSIGMTAKEFNRMIRLESILYGLKSLIIGIPLGCVGSYFIYKSFAESIDVGYTLPYKAILISIVFVFIIIGFTMKYSLNKINKQNIIETIRKENI